MLLFGRSTVINPDPITIDRDWLAIELDSPIKAINGGASIRIDITKYIQSDSTVDALEEIRDSFPAGCVKAVLESNNGKSVIFDQTSSSVSSTEKAIKLTPKDPVPVNIKFTKVKLSSCIVIKDTKATWYNFGK